MFTGLDPTFYWILSVLAFMGMEVYFCQSGSSVDLCVSSKATSFTTASTLLPTALAWEVMQSPPSICPVKVKDIGQGQGNGSG